MDMRPLPQAWSFSYFGSLVLARARAVDVSSQRVVDLSHAYGASTVYWPTSPTKFTWSARERTTEGGYFYAANTLCTPEHGGTHLDAPFHFSESGRTTEQIPLEQLIAPAVVIDVQQSSADRDYRLTREDVMQFEKSHGPIRPAHRPAADGMEPALARRQRLSRGRYARRRVQALVPLVRRGRREAAGRRAASPRLGIETASIDYGKSKSSKCIGSRPQGTSPVWRISPIWRDCRRAGRTSSPCR